jgi:hypothetical protein
LAFTGGLLLGVRLKFAGTISETGPAVAPQYASTMILVHGFLFTSFLMAEAAKTLRAVMYVRRKVDTFGPLKK